MYLKWLWIEKMNCFTLTERKNRRYPAIKNYIAILTDKTDEAEILLHKIEYHA